MSPVLFSSRTSSFVSCLSFSFVMKPSDLRVSSGGHRLRAHQGGAEGVLQTAAVRRSDQQTNPQLSRRTRRRAGRSGRGPHGGRRQWVTPSTAGGRLGRSQENLLWVFSSPMFPHQRCLLGVFWEAGRRGGQRWRLLSQSLKGRRPQKFLRRKYSKTTEMCKDNL